MAFFISSVELMEIKNLIKSYQQIKYTSELEKVDFAKNLNPHQKKIFKSLLGDGNMMALSSDLLIESAQKALKKAKKVNVVSPIALNEELRESVESFIDTICHDVGVFLIEYNLDRSIIAGCVIELDGKYIDLSLKNKLYELLRI